jgi:hypothetical protein
MEEKIVWKHCCRGSKSDINGACETASRVHAPAPSRAMSTIFHKDGRAIIAGFLPRRTEFGPGAFHGALLVARVAVEHTVF